jgi:maltose O-acetyltransferase
MKYIFLLLYYSLLVYLPKSTTPIAGKICKRLRYECRKRIFKFCGTNVNIEKGARFGKGTNVVIGNNSGIGVNYRVPNDIFIGDNVMMGPDVLIISENHKFERTDILMIFQGRDNHVQIKMTDDVWIGQRTIILPGKQIEQGSIIGAGAVVSKNIPSYSIAIVNPIIIKNRKNLN